MKIVVAIASHQRITYKNLHTPISIPYIYFQTFRFWSRNGYGSPPKKGGGEFLMYMLKKVSINILFLMTFFSFK